ncbi:MAG: periplasmic heavy metal sensor [Desulfomicrobium sp.]|nr:periplasmic heavy metal sensor [Desulfomicrobium sp.]NLV97272.1 periplasmic heavy metal sensor [Desulfovibrionales bacterium]
MKKSMITLLTLMALVLTSFAYAQGPGYGRGMGCWGGNYQAWDQLTPEKHELVRNLFDAHHKDTAALRSSMWEKQTLLDTLAANPATSPETLTALIREMGQLRTQMEEKQEILRAKINKEIGINIPMDCGHYGYGPGRGGYGHMGGHMGYGRHMGGYGPGYNDEGPRGYYHGGHRGMMRNVPTK